MKSVRRPEKRKAAFPLFCFCFLQISVIIVKGEEGADDKFQKGKNILRIFCCSRWNWRQHYLWCGTYWVGLWLVYLLEPHHCHTTWYKVVNSWCLFPRTTHHEVARHTSRFTTFFRRRLKWRFRDKSPVKGARRGENVYATKTRLCLSSCQFMGERQKGEWELMAWVWGQKRRRRKCVSSVRNFHRNTFASGWGGGDE